MKQNCCYYSHFDIYFFISPNGHSIFFLQPSIKQHNTHLNEFLLVWDRLKTTSVGLNQGSYGDSLVLSNHSLLRSGVLDILCTAQSLFIGIRTVILSAVPHKPCWDFLKGLLFEMIMLPMCWRGHVSNEWEMSEWWQFHRTFLWNCGEPQTLLSDLDLQMHCVSKQRRDGARMLRFL